MAKNILHLVVGLLVGAVIGFLLANLLAPAPISEVAEQGGAGVGPGQAESSTRETAPLSSEEIRRAIARADQEPKNLELQKELGTRLLRYATFTGDTSFLDDLTRLLTRVYTASPRDPDVLAALGDIEFIKARTGEQERLKSAETFYQKSLAVKADNSDVRSNLGLVYLNEEPPSYKRARGEFEKALKSDPTNERALQGAALASIRSGDQMAAKSYIEAMKLSHPNSGSIAQLETELGQAGNSTNGN